MPYHSVLLTETWQWLGVVAEMASGIKNHGSNASWRRADTRMVSISHRENAKCGRGRPRRRGSHRHEAQQRTGIVTR